MLATMTKKQHDPGGHKRYPSREKTKYIGIPAELYELVRKRAEEEDRSVSATAKRIIARYFQDNPVSEGK